MSLQTVKICDIDRCGKVATDTLENFLYTRWLDNGSEMVLLKDIDLCGSHYMKYKSQIPAVKINGDNAHLSNERTVL